MVTYVYIQVHQLNDDVDDDDDNDDNNNNILGENSTCILKFRSRKKMFGNITVMMMLP